MEQSELVMGKAGSLHCGQAPQDVSGLGHMVLLRTLKGTRLKSLQGQRSNGLSGDAEQTRDKESLADRVPFCQPFHSALPDHVHRFNPLDRPPRALKRAVASLASHARFFTLRWSCSMTIELPPWRAHRASGRLRGGRSRILWRASGLDRTPGSRAVECGTCAVDRSNQLATAARALATTARTLPHSRAGCHPRRNRLPEHHVCRFTYLGVAGWAAPLSRTSRSVRWIRSTAGPSGP